MTLRAALAPLLVLLCACAAPRQVPLTDQRWWRETAELPQAPLPPGLKVAFLGDQSLRPEARAVLELIAAEGADAVLHQGDFDYKDDPAAWEEQIDAVLGRDFPYFASVGNHDEDAFYGPDGYQERIARRLERLGIPWRGEPGVHCAVRWNGLLLLFAAPGVLGLEGELEAAFLRDELTRDRSPWRICSWHKNQHAMQTGGKRDETGWEVYEEARRGGAVIVTGHEHAYSRSHLLASCERQEVATAEGGPLALQRDDPATPDDEGRTFVVVSGLGGHSVRQQQTGGPWWACVATKDKGARPGALFAEFHHQGDPRLARFYFKDVEGRVVDEFVVRAPE